MPRGFWQVQAMLTAPILLAAAGAARGQESANVGYITDLSLCTPKSAISDGPQEGRWQLIPYETVDDPSIKAGTIIGAASYVDAPDITLPLDASGWHAIYVGYWNPYHAYDGGTTLKLKLSDDPCFIRIKEPEPGLEYKSEGARLVSQTYLKEAFFANADLTGRDLVLGKVNGPFGEKAYYAYVKLAPLSDQEVAALEAERANPDARDYAGSIDGLSYFWGNEYRTPEHLLELVEPFRHSRIGRIFWAVNNGGTTHYPSKVGTLWEQWGGSPIAQSTNAYIKGEKVGLQSLTSYLARGVIPENVAAQHLHQMGLKFDIMFRLGIGGFEYLPPRRGAQPEGFLVSHPQFRMAMADGTRVEKASYAYPQVRAFMVSMIAEAAGMFDVDGVSLGFGRGPQFIGYDPPVLEEFQRRYGEDGTKVGFDDPRMRAVRSEFMTRFVREARRAVDGVGRKKGRRLELSAWIFDTLEHNLDCGLDVMAWINEGLVESLVVVATDDPRIRAAAQEHGCRMVSAIWDIDGQADTPAGRVWQSAEVRARAQDVSIKLKTIGGIDVSQGYWETAFSGG